MSMTDWAKQEIKLACKRENPNWDGKSFDYGCACYQSALKAYESLMKDEHSGISFSFTKNILIRLMEGLPLLPIEDKDFFMVSDNPSMESDEALKEKGLKSLIQCPRMCSLFRKETLDGKVTYFDNDRICCFDIHDPKYAFYNGFAAAIINDIYPITMPYYPSNAKYKVYIEDFLTDKRNGDFDTKGILYCITPKGEKVEINRFFAENSETHEWSEISKEEYEKRKAVKLYLFKDEIEK